MTVTFHSFHLVKVFQAIKHVYQDPNPREIKVCITGIFLKQVPFFWAKQGTCTRFLAGHVTGDRKRNRFSVLLMQTRRQLSFKLQTRREKRKQNLPNKHFWEHLQSTKIYGFHSDNFNWNFVFLMILKGGDGSDEGGGVDGKGGGGLLELSGMFWITRREWGREREREGRKFQAWLEWEWQVIMFRKWNDKWNGEENELFIWYLILYM